MSLVCIGCRLAIHGDCGSFRSSVCWSCLDAFSEENPVLLAWVRNLRRHIPRDAWMRRQVTGVALTPLEFLAALRAAVTWQSMHDFVAGTVAYYDLFSGTADMSAGGESAGVVALRSIRKTLVLVSRSIQWRWRFFLWVTSFGSASLIREGKANGVAATGVERYQSPQDDRIGGVRS